MGIFKEYVKALKNNRLVKNEANFEKMNEKERKKLISTIKKLDEKKLEREIEKAPYIFPHVIGDLKVSKETMEKLVAIASKNDVNVYDMIDKKSILTNAEIVNVAVKNQDGLFFELEDMPALQDLITTETLIELFVNNPEVIFANYKLLDKKFEIEGINKDGKESKRSTTLRKQFQRALNIYFRPNTYRGNKFDEFAKSIADKISTEQFNKLVQENKVLTRSTTAANEILKKEPQKGEIMPAKALKRWNNRVLYTIPNQIRKELKSKVSADRYKKFVKYNLGLLQNSSLGAFTEKERTKLAKRCVTICPEIFFELTNINEFAHTAKELTVQLSAYKALKDRGQTELKDKLLSNVGEAQSKKIVARDKANTTRNKNKAKKAKLQKADNEKQPEM